VQETLNEYKAALSKFLKPKKVSMQQGVMLEQDDCPETPDPLEEVSFWVSAQWKFLRLAS
jgi:hypothetical protein